MDAQQFYDENVPRRLHDFLFGNPRIDAAFRSIVSGVGGPPRSVLEVGCGIGFVAWQLQQRWPQAHLVGLDMSGVSISIARELFGDSGVQYEQGKLQELDLRGPFELIVMMDVYEHVESGQRELLHRQVNELLSPTGSLFVSVPTTEYQQHLRSSRPGSLQPVDEDVSPADLERLARVCHATIVSYEKVTVWRKLDYAHCWIRRVPGAGSERPSPRTLVNRVEGRIRKTLVLNPRERRRRANRVGKRLGPEWLEAARQA